jgi:hypothetical protein
MSVNGFPISTFLGLFSHKTKSFVVQPKSLRIFGIHIDLFSIKKRFSMKRVHKVGKQ